MAKIGLAKRQKTVRQKGEIRTGGNHPITFQGEVLHQQGKPPNSRRTAEALIGIRAIGRKRRALQERKPTLEDETPQGGLGKGKERLQYPESSFTAILPKGPFGGLPEALAAARRGTLAA